LTITEEKGLKGCSTLNLFHPYFEEKTILISRKPFKTSNQTTPEEKMGGGRDRNLVIG